MNRRITQCGWILVFIALAAPAAFGATVQWTNSSGGNWSTGTNWSGGSAPGSADDVVINAAGVYTVTLDVNPTVNSLTIGAATGTQTLKNPFRNLTITTTTTIGVNGVLSQEGGTLSVAGMTNNGKLDWTGGTITGVGTVTNDATINITGSSGKSWDKLTLSNGGNVVSNSGSYIYLYNSPVFNNLAGGFYDIQSDSGYYIGSGTPVFNNSGTVSKTAGAGIKDFYFVFNNSGTLNVQSGSLRLASGGTSSGNYNVSSGATLQFYGGTHTLSNTTSVSGAGSVIVTSGTVSIAGTYNVASATTVNGGTLTLTGTVSALGAITASSGTFNLNTNNTITSLGSPVISGGTFNITSTAAFTIANLTVSSGTFSGNCALTVNGWTWSGGTINVTNTITLPAGSDFNLTGSSARYLYSATINNSGDVTSTMTGYVYLYNNVTFNNLAGATFDSQTDGSFYIGSGTPVFNNSGTLTKSGGTGTMDFYFVFNNNGTFNLQSGTMRLANGGISSGPYNVSSGATLQFYGGTHTLSNTSSIAGGGSVQVSSGTVSLAGNYNISTATTINGGTLNLTGSVLALGTLSVSSGAFNLNTNSTITSLGAVTLSGGTLALDSTAAFTMTGLTFSNGTFGGSAGVTISGTFAWSGGTIQRTGAIDLPSGSAFNITGPSARYWYTATINNSGTTTSSMTGYVYLYNGATFNNLAGSTYDIQSDGSYYIGSGTPVFNNSSTLTKSGGTGTEDFYFVFNNNGTLNVNSGILRLANGGTSNGAYNVASGAGIQFYGGTHTLNATASISGAGNVKCSGGTVTVAGTYNVTGTTTVDGGALTLSGTTSATGIVAVSAGTLTIDGAALAIASLTVSNGTLAGTAPLTVTTFVWSGGTINRTGSITLPSGSTTSISGASTKYFYSLTINNSGAVTSTTTGSVYGYNGAVINNLAGATYDIQSDGSYYIGANPLTTFNNSGTVTKSAGTGIKDFYFIFNNTGTLNVNSGTLRLANGGTSSGAYNVASGAKLQFYGGTHTLNGSASIAGAGTVEASGGTVNLAGTYNITAGTTANGGTLNLSGTLTATGPVTISNGEIDFNTTSATVNSLTLSGGTLGGSTALTVTGTFAWSSGTVNRSGAVNINAGAFFNVSSTSTRYWYQSALNNSGTASHNGVCYTYFYNGGSFNNLAGATWDFQSDFYYYFGGGAAPAFNNSGTVTKSGGAGVSDVAIAFNNNNALNVNSGTLRLMSGGTGNGAQTVASGATLRYAGGTHTLSGSISGAGITDFNSGTVTLSGTYTPAGDTTISGGTFNLDSASAVSIPVLILSNGTLGGSSVLSITSAFTWSAGTVNRSGTVNINSGAALNLTTTNTRYWYQATLNNSGTVTSGTNFWLYVYNGAVFNNNAGATWQLPSDSGYYSAGGATPTFNNSGTVNKNVGTSVLDFYYAFNNNGQVNVTSGTLRLMGTDTSSGAFTIGSGTTLRLHGVTHTFDASSSITGSGTFDVTSGTVNLNGSYTVTGTTSLGGGILNVNTPSPLSLATLTMSGGTLGGSQTLNMTSTFDWSGGTVDRSGAVNINFGATLNFTTTATRYWYQATLNNSGTVTGGNNFWLYIYNGAIFNNLAGATWQLPSQSGYYSAGGGAPQFNNSGQLNKNAGATQTDFYPQLTNNGTLTVSAGTLRFLGGGSGSGTYSVSAGGVLQFGSGSYALATASTLTGAGTVEFAGGSVAFSGAYNVSGTTNINGGTLDLNGASPATINALNFSNGTLGGSGAVSLTGTSTWSGGTINRSGATNVPSGATLNITTGSTKYIYQTTFGNSGNVVYNGAAALYAYNGAVLNNLAGALFEFKDNSSIYFGGGATPQFNNSGTVRKSTGTTYSEIGIPFNNDGTLQVQTNVVRLTAGGTSNGTYDVSSGATLRFLGGTHTLNASASMTGAGAIDAASGTITNAGGYNVTGGTTVSGAIMTLSGTITNISPLTASNGQINLNVAATTTIASFTLSGGTLGGTTPLIVNTFAWSSGTVNRSGSIDIPSGSVMNLTSANARYLYQATINNSGTINAPMSGYIYLYNGTTLNNLAGGVVDLQGDAAFWYGGGAVAQFVNTGTLRKSAGTTTAQFAWALTNNGTLELQSGILALAGGFTQSASGLYRVSIGGTTAGTLYAKGQVTGTATLNGAMNVVLTGGFTPTVGDNFQVLSFTSRSGDFATKTGLTYPGGSMSYAANATNVTLTGATATADLSITKTVSNGTVATGAAFSYTLTANNLGPSAATGVSVTDTLPSGVTLNSASGSGWTCNSNGGTPPTITCTMASLAVSTPSTITLSVTAPASPTSITNSAAITSNIGDPVSSNDTSSVGTTIVTPTPGVTVTSAADSGAGTLRQALIDANTGVCSSPCTIAFNIAAPSPIAITSGLPAIIANGVTIDGTTQSGYSGTPIIELTDGGCACTVGIELQGGGSTIRGITIRGFSAKGLWLNGGTGAHTIELSTFGTSSSPNGIGIYVGSANNLIRTNSVAFNGGAGIAVGSAVAGNRILASSIHDNSGIGIDLNNDGATGNDGGDYDTGANNYQNTPVISAANASAGTLNATLDVDSIGVPGTGSIRVELFEDDTAGEGMTYLGGACFAGNSLINQVVSVPATGIASGDKIVATATSYSGTGCVTVNDGTSEFSPSFSVNTCSAPDATITAPVSVCAGTSGHTASVAFVSGASYSWTITNGTISGSTTTNSITFSPGPSGTVDLQVTVNDSGCSSNGTASIPINTATPASITPSGPTTFCAGGSVTLSANSGSSYLWNTGATTQSIVANTAGSYSVTVTDTNGCSSSSTATVVTVNPAPVVNITGPTAMCAATSVTLDAGTGFATYSWSTGETTQQIIVSPAVTTDYTVTVTNGSGCSASDTHTVTVDPNPSPTITPSGPTTFCSGGSVTLASSAGNSYQWYRDAALLGGETNATILATISGSYTVTVTNAGGCSGTSSPAVVTVNNTTTPTITPAGPTTFCAGGSVTLNASAGSSYQWSLDGNPIGSATGASYIANANGNYTVTVTDANGCTATSAAQSVVVYTAPIVNISGPTATCASGSVSLDAGPGFATYSWSTGETTRVINVSPLTTTNYNVTVYDANGCSASDSHTVNVTGNPSATISAPPTACAGAGGNNANVASQPGASYAWAIANGTITSPANANAITFAAGPSGTVSLDVTVTIGACSTSGSATVAINTPPTVTITGNTATCAGGSVTLDAGAGYATYQWSTTEITRFITVAPSSTTTYSVIVTDANNCSASDTHTVTVNPAPAVAITGPTSTCPSTPVTLDAGAGFSTYAWSTGQTTQTITVTPSTDTTYSVTVTNANGCSNSDSHTVTVTASPSTLISSPANVCASSGAHTASVAAQTGATYAWTISGGSITGGQNTDVITFSAGPGGNVILNVTVTSGSCSSSGSRTIAIDPPPAVAITGPTTACTGTPITLSVPNTFASYQWSNGQTTPSITVTQFSTVQTYSVIVTNANGCSATANHTVTLNASPSAAISAPASVDPLSTGNNASVAAQAGASYTWTIANGTITAGAGTNSITFSAGNSGTVDLTLSVTLNSCTSNGNTSVPIGSPIPQEADFAITKSAPSSVQTGASLTYTIVITNNGPVNAAGTMIDTLPSGVALTNLSDGTWSCNPTATQVPCSGFLDAGQSVTILVTVTAPQQAGTITNNVSVDTTVTDPNASNNFASATTTITPVNSTDPCANRGTATLMSPPNNAVINNSEVTLQWLGVGANEYRVWVSIDGAAPQLVGTTSQTSLPVTLTNGQVEWWIEVPYPGCPSTESQHFHFTIPAAQNCGTDLPVLVSPANGSTVTNANVLFDWNGVANAVSYDVYLALNDGAPALIGTTSDTSLTAVVAEGTLSWFVVANVNQCDPRSSLTSQFTYDAPVACEDNQRAIPVSPLDETTSTSPVTFDWSDVDGATKYELYTVRGDNAPVLLGTTTNSQLTNVNLATGALRWFVRTYYGQNCSPLDSEERQLEIVATPPPCSELTPPVVSAPGEISSNVEFLLQWNAVIGATGYQLQIADNGQFDNAQVINTSATSHSMLAPLSGAVYARVRAIDAACQTSNVSAYGPTAIVFVLPPQSTTGSVPLADPTVVHYAIALGAELAGQSFSAVPTEEWLSVTPSSGVVREGGMTLDVSANTSDLGVGGHSGAIKITLNSSSAGALSTHATTSITPTISVNLVTPVKPVVSNTPSPDTMIIPAVANADGINAHFQSDVRVANTSPQLIKYQLTFIPSGDAGISQGRQTTFSIEPGQTIALDDVLKSWFGTGGSNAIGVLQIKPLTTTSSSTSTTSFGPLANLVSFASSRTFNVTPQGTFGTFIPAVPFANYAGKSSVLSLQQIAQSARFRSNLGLHEGSGSPADVLIKVFGSNGQQLTQFTKRLNGGQHTQLNAFLFERGITLQDGRVEVSVTSSTGKITAYASVLDNETSDAVLVTPVALGEEGNTKWVIPGVADIKSGFADWQSDVRIFNADTQPANLTATFYSQGGGEPKVTSLTLNAGEVKQLDKVLPTLFGITGDGGALHLATTKASRIIATARTYNQTTSGTYGQFISAITPAEAAAVGTRPLQLLQVEESARFRSNIGFVNVTDKPVKLEVTITPPDAKFTGSIEVELAPNEYRQMNSLLASLGLGDTYNARVSVRAISGEGRATVFASVIDLATNDPLYMQGQ